MPILTGWLGKLVYAILVGVVTYIVILIIAYVLGLFPMLSPIADILKRFAYILALLAALVTFLTGWVPFRRAV